MAEESKNLNKTESSSFYKIDDVDRSTPQYGIKIKDEHEDLQA